MSFLYSTVKFNYLSRRVVTMAWHKTMYLFLWYTSCFDKPIKNIDYCVRRKTIVLRSKKWPIFESVTSADSPGAHEFISVFRMVRFVFFLVFCIAYCDFCFAFRRYNGNWLSLWYFLNIIVLPCKQLVCILSFSYYYIVNVKVINENTQLIR